MKCKSGALLSDSTCQTVAEGTKTVVGSLTACIIHIVIDPIYGDWYKHPCTAGCTAWRICECARQNGSLSVQARPASQVGVHRPFMLSCHISLSPTVLGGGSSSFHALWLRNWRTYLVAGLLGTVTLDGSRDRTTVRKGSGTPLQRKYAGGR